MNPSPGVRVAEDQHIIAGLQERDPAAMAALYDRYGRIVFSVAFRILGNSGEAEDAVQEIFLRVWTRVHQIDQTSVSLAPWLLSVTRNLCIDCLRMGGRDRRKEQMLSGSFPSRTSSEISHSIDCSRALHELRHEERQIIELAYFEGLSQTEISARIGTPLGTVKTRVRTALSSLRRTMVHRS